MRWQPIILTGLALVVGASPTAASPVKVRTSNGKFDSGRKAIKVELFEPDTGNKAAVKHPAIVLLHDSAGLGLPMPGPIYRLCCRLLAREGYVVLLVHYFDQTGHERVEPGKVSREQFKAWMDTVRDAVKYAARQKQVDSRRIGMLGFSLGAYLSLAVAAQKDLKIAAVGEFFGGLPDELRKELKHLPPTLIVHGDKDKVVPVKTAYDLKRLLEAKKLTYQMRVYPGQEHMFRGESMTGKVLADVRRCTILFFATHLKKAALNKDGK